MKQVILIEDVQTTREEFAAELRAAGYSVDAFDTAEAARKALEEKTYDAVVLDLELHGNRYAGITLMTDARDDKLRLPPVLVTSSLDPKDFRPMTLRLGAWDHLPKPIEPGTLTLKVQRLLDATATTRNATKVAGSLQWNLSAPGVLHWRGSRVRLALTGWKLVDLLATRAPVPVDYDELTGMLLTGDREALRRHVASVRQAFRDVDPKFDAIRTVPGKGYMWAE